MKLTSVTLALVALLFSLDSTAGTLSAVINGKSYHVDASHDWNEDNYGFGLEYQFDSHSRWKTSAMASGFRDSNDSMSYVAGGSLHRRLLQSERLAGFYFDAGLTAFLMTREDINGNRPFPGILPSIALGNRHLGFNLAYLPEAGVTQVTNSRFDDPTLKGIFYLQMKISLDRFLPSSR